MRRRRSARAQVLLYIALAALLSFSLGPVLWMLSTSFKTRFDVFGSPGSLLPLHWTLSAYKTVLTDPHFTTYFANSLIVNVAASLLTVLLATIAGYSFSRFHFRGREALLLFILATQMFPSAVLLIALYIMFRHFGMLNSYPALIVSYVTFGLPFSIWMMRGFVDAVPVEIEHAAMIDGCTRANALVRVVAPMMLPGVIAVALFSFLAGWNDLIWALTINTSPGMKLIPPGFVSTYVGQFQTYWNQLMAGSVLVSLPTVVIFMLLQRYLVAGLTAGGVKG